MEELFKPQLEENRKVTNEMLDTMEDSCYHNGETMNVGDVPLFAFIKNGNEIDTMFTLVKIKEEHFNLYDGKQRGNGKLPLIKLKTIN